METIKRSRFNIKNNILKIVLSKTIRNSEVTNIGTTWRERIHLLLIYTTRLYNVM